MGRSELIPLAQEIEELAPACNLLNFRKIAALRESLKGEQITHVTIARAEAAFLRMDDAWAGRLDFGNRLSMA